MKKKEKEIDFYKLWRVMILLCHPTLYLDVNENGFGSHLIKICSVDWLYLEV